MRTHTESHTLTYTHNTHTHTLSDPSHTLTHTHTLTHFHSHTHIHSYSHSHTHTHTLTHSPKPIHAGCLQTADCSWFIADKVEFSVAGPDALQPPVNAELVTATSGCAPIPVTLFWLVYQALCSSEAVGKEGSCRRVWSTGWLWALWDGSARRILLAPAGPGPGPAAPSVSPPLVARRQRCSLSCVGTAKPIMEVCA